MLSGGSEKEHLLFFTRDVTENSSTFKSYLMKYSASHKMGFDKVDRFDPR